MLQIRFEVDQRHHQHTRAATVERTSCCGAKVIPTTSNACTGWYREEGLSLRLKRPRRNKAAKLRQPKPITHAVNELWSMDFVADELLDGRKLRVLTVVDCYTRECLAIEGRALVEGRAGALRVVELIGSGWAWGTSFSWEATRADDFKARAQSAKLVADLDLRA